ncbi:MAG: BatA and WFA domain-containing protein [Nanoarchaeota archaeon]
MAFQLGSLLFNNLIPGVYAFASLIPLIIIYLIRPRPVSIEIPSLMFFLTTHDNPKRQSFLRKIVKDWLFLIHFLILALLAFNLMQPYNIYEHDIASQNTVIVLDVSASSQVIEGGSSRFENGIDAALQAVKDHNTIILAKHVPSIVLRDGTMQEAKETLQTLRPMDTSSAIGEAMILAGEILANKEGRVVVVSDFINTDGVDPITAKAALGTQNIVVDLINTAQQGRKQNIGITAMDIDEDSSTVFIHNYEQQPASVRLHIGDLTKDITIPSLGTQSYSFKTPSKVTKVTIDNNDDFDADDVAYISSPEKKPIKVLLITNNESVFLSNALKSLPEVMLTIAEPPIVPKGDYDIYIVHDIIPKNVLPGTYEDIADHVKKGKTAIIAASDNYIGVDFKGLLSVRLTAVSNKTLTLVEQINSFTKNIDFGGMDRYYNASLLSGAIQLVSDGKNNSIMAYQQQGSGKVVWYGIMERYSDFKVNPSYPIFWAKLVEFLTNQESIKNLNLHTGDTIILDDIKVIKTPTRTISTNTISFDETGIYEVDGRKIAASLLNEKESEINPSKVIAASSGKQIMLKPVKEKREFEWEIPLLIGVIVIVFFELIYVKLRGDL